MKNHLFTRLQALLFCCVFCCMLLPYHSWAETGKKPDVRLSAYNQLTLRARDASLRDILSRLADQGIRIRIDPAIDFKVNAAYEKQPINEVLDAILGANSHALIWQEEPGGPEDGGYRLAEIQIYRPGHRERMTLLEDKNFKIGRLPETGALFVRHELLVQLKNQKFLDRLKSLLAAAGGRIVNRTPGGIYRIKLPEAVDELAFLAKLKEINGLSGAEPNYAYQAPRAFKAVSPDVDLPEIKSRAPEGSPVPVAVFDSGLSPEYQKQPYILDTFNAVDPERPVDDGLGHGTQMSLLAAGAAHPMGLDADEADTVPVIAIRGFDENGLTSNYTLMQGIAHAMEKGARVLSLSWHSETESAFLEEAIAKAAENGLTVVAAAGNEPTGQPVYPAAYDSVLGVGALQPDGKKWENSNFGDFVSHQAPGFANLPVGYKSDPGIYAGTSIATAYTANRIAAYLARHPGAGTEDIQKILTDKASPAPEARPLPH